MSQRKCAYEGPDIETLPGSIAKVVRDLQERLPIEAYIELGVNTFNKSEFDSDKYLRIHASDDRGLVQTVYYDGGSAYNFRIIGDLPRGTREKAMSYDKSRTVVLKEPDKEPFLSSNPFLIEAEPK